MPTGYFSIILHAHLPFVRHPEYPEFLEEDWLFEAISETYIPLLNVFESCALDGVRARDDGADASALRNAFGPVAARQVLAPRHEARGAMRKRGRAHARFRGDE